MAENDLPEGEGAAKPASQGVSKKQQRIADLVKEQLYSQLKDDLEQAVHAHLAHVAQPKVPAAQPPMASRASRVIPPSGPSAPAPDLNNEYQKRLRAIRRGDLGAVLELKREFRNKGLEVY